MGVDRRVRIAFLVGFLAVIVPPLMLWAVTGPGAEGEHATDKVAATVVWRTGATTRDWSGPPDDDCETGRLDGLGPGEFQYIADRTASGCAVARITLPGLLFVGKTTTAAPILHLDGWYDFTGSDSVGLVATPSPLRVELSILHLTGNFVDGIEARQESSILLGPSGPIQATLSHEVQLKEATFGVSLLIRSWPGPSGDQSVMQKPTTDAGPILRFRFDRAEVVDRRSLPLFGQAERVREDDGSVYDRFKAYILFNGELGPGNVSLFLDPPTGYSIQRVYEQHPGPSRSVAERSIGDPSDPPQRLTAYGDGAFFEYDNPPHVDELNVELWGPPSSGAVLVYGLGDLGFLLAVLSPVLACTWFIGRGWGVIPFTPRIALSRRLVFNGVLGLYLWGLTLAAFIWDHGWGLVFWPLDVAEISVGGGGLLVATGFVLLEVQRVRKESQYHADRSDEMRSLAYGATHDLKAPLAGVQWALDDAIERLSAGEAVDSTGIKQDLERVRGNIGDMGGLVGDLLTLAQAGEDEATPQRVDLGATARRVADGLQARAAAARGRIELGTTWPTVTGYPAALRQLLHNLIDNGIKYGDQDKGPVVRLEAQRRGGLITVHVDDNGPGIAAPYRDMVFGVLARNPDERRSIDGTGIGLALVRRVARNHGGDVTIEDSPLGGARFVVTLPVHG